MEATGSLALALFNRQVSRWRGDALYLHESDDPVLNSIFIEHNGPLLDPGPGRSRQAVLARLLQDAMHAPVGGKRGRPRRLVLSGVGPDCAEAAAITDGLVAHNLARVAPYVDFSVRARGPAVHRAAEPQHPPPIAPLLPAL